MFDTIDLELNNGFTADADSAAINLAENAVSGFTRLKAQPG